MAANYAVNAPHSAVTALAKSRKRRAASRARLNVALDVKAKDDR